jgi:hypothetical protein
VVLPRTSTTTTTESAVGTGESEPRSEGSSVAAAAGLEDAFAGVANGRDEASAFPVVPVAGGATVLAVAGIWWLAVAKRAATRPAAPTNWAIPHGGVRPPQ